MAADIRAKIQIQLLDINPFIFQNIIGKKIYNKKFMAQIFVGSVYGLME